MNPFESLLRCFLRHPIGTLEMQLPAYDAPVVYWQVW